MYKIGRPINGISLNGNEYVCDENGKLMLFDSKEQALAMLYDAGYTDKSIDASGIIIQEEHITFAAAKNENDTIYCKWLRLGRPEAFSELNDSNRRVIRAYMDEHPDAVGYKFYEGLIELKDNPLYNFCCDYIFDRRLAETVLKTDPLKITDVLTTSNSCCLAWS